MLDACRRPTNSTLTIAFLAADSPEARRALGRLTKRYPQVAPSKADVIVALGGDGMMLESLHRFMGRGTPIYGMNCGTIGFLMNKYNEADLPARLAAAQLVKLHPLTMTARTLSSARMRTVTVSPCWLVALVENAAAPSESTTI